MTHIVGVYGEPTVDWLTVQSEPPDIECSPLPGGAFLLSGILEQVGAGSTRLGLSWSASLATPANSYLHHCYATVAKEPHPRKELGEVWAIKDFIGRKKGRKLLRADDLDPAAAAGADTPDLVVLDDEDLGFGSDPELWPSKALAAAASSWIILKMKGHIAEGKLWDELYPRAASRLIVVLDIKDLRQGELEVSKNLSWEGSARELAAELLHKPSINSLSQCSYVVVHFGAVGALLLMGSKDPSQEWLPRFKLLFDSDAMEGEWEHSKSKIWGHTSVLAAAIAAELMSDPSTGIDQPTDDNVEKAIKRGLLAMQALDATGYVIGARKELEFPFAKVGHCIRSAPLPAIATAVFDPPILTRSDLISAEVRRPILRRREFLSGRELSSAAESWTILRGNHDPEGLNGLARRIARKGVEEALHNVPRARFGDLLTVDRQEIEDFRSIQSLVKEYGSGTLKVPLSIAVFGAPGSGKSYAVMQILEELEKSGSHRLGGGIEKLEFNISQFAGMDELIDAFHLVRDEVLKGQMPVVFWDEFDTSHKNAELGWLRYFLAPMHDGTFREGAAQHTIGRCIFVFAGGRSSRFRDFRNILKDDDKFRAVKGPDFLSRIRGYIDIRGPNEEESLDGSVEVDDPYFIVRRAIYLRSLLWEVRKNLFGYPVPKKGGQEAGRTLSIDGGVLNAFLKVRRYEHGVRSMKAIIEMSALTGKSTFDRSCLPAVAQLGLHVETRDFLGLMRNIDLPGIGGGFDDDDLALLPVAAEILARLGGSRAVQESRSRLRGDKDGYKCPEPGISFASLADNEKEQFREFVRCIPNMLEDEGYRIVKGEVEPRVESLPGAVVEVLAKREHERWRNSKISARWNPGLATEKGRKIHQMLEGWDNLKSWQKEFDFQRVSAIPDALFAVDPKLSIQNYVRDGEE